MDTRDTVRKVEPSYLQKAFSYTAYKELVDNLLAEGRTTGPNQSEAFIHYSQLNQQRVHRLEKTIQVLPSVAASIQSIRSSQTWLILTEAWCGDAAQSLPVMEALALLNPVIDLRVLLRDENPELMDRYLTNGVSRSIPKLIGLNTATLEERWVWGPRPSPLQNIFLHMREMGTSFDTIKEELQRWYNKDKTVTIQQELAELAAGAVG